MEEAKRKMEEEAEERIKKQAEEQKEFQKLEKKKHIQQSLKKIQENKMKRDEIIKASEQQYQQLYAFRNIGIQNIQKYRRSSSNSRKK